MGTQSLSPTPQTERTVFKRSGTKTIDEAPLKPRPRLSPLPTVQTISMRAFKHTRMRCMSSVGVKRTMRLTTGCRRRERLGHPRNLEASGLVLRHPTYHHHRQGHKG